MTLMAKVRATPRAGIPGTSVGGPVGTEEPSGFGSFAWSCTVYPETGSMASLKYLAKKPIHLAQS